MSILMKQEEYNVDAIVHFAKESTEILSRNAWDNIAAGIQHNFTPVTNDPTRGQVVLPPQKSYKLFYETEKNIACLIEQDLETNKNIITIAYLSEGPGYEITLGRTPIGFCSPIKRPYLTNNRLVYFRDHLRNDS